MKKFRIVRPTRKPPGQVVWNLSSRVLTVDQEGVLSRGLKFAPTPAAIPVVELFAATEKVCKAMPDQSRVADFRFRVSRMLQVAQPPGSNLKPTEKSALRSLSRDRKITIVPADKGNAVVVLDSSME